VSPTSHAMAIAGLDRSKFNDAVFKGHYKCAPETTEGSYRLFDEIDIVGLTVFARCLEAGFSARHAGSYACTTVDLMRQGELGSFYQVRSVDGKFRDVFTAKGQPIKEQGYATLFEINLANIRDHVRQAVATVSREEGVGGTEGHEAALLAQAKKLRERAAAVEARLQERKNQRELRQVRALLAETDFPDEEVSNEPADTEKEHAE